MKCFLLPSSPPDHEAKVFPGWAVPHDTSSGAHISPIIWRGALLLPTAWRESDHSWEGRLSAQYGVRRGAPREGTWETVLRNWVWRGPGALTAAPEMWRAGKSMQEEGAEQTPGGAALSRTGRSSRTRRGGTSWQMGSGARWQLGPVPKQGLTCSARWSQTPPWNPGRAASLRDGLRQNPEADARWSRAGQP